MARRQGSIRAIVIRLRGHSGENTLSLKVKGVVRVENLDEILENLDRTFNRNQLGDDDDETPLSREVYALEEAVKKTLAYLKEKGE